MVCYAHKRSVLLPRCDKILKKNKNVDGDVCLNFLLRVPYLFGVIANTKQKRGVIGDHNNGDSLGRTSYL